MSASGAEAGHDLSDRLRGFAGLTAGPDRHAPDPVNGPMIRHFAEATGDENPIYVDGEAARAAGRDGIVAPPPMVSTWLMAGYRERMAARSAPPADSPFDRLLGLLDDAGFTGVVATNDEQTYHRELRLGDQLSMSAVIEDVSPCKRTSLGPGHFVTTLRTFRDAHGEIVAEQRFRILRFRPKAADSADVTADLGADRSGDVSQRPKPAVLRDNEFWFAAAREHRLVIQACDDCGRLRHPPSPACPHCRSFGWHEVTASGRGTVHSYVIGHHPKAPGFEYPLAVVLADLDEGTRLLADFAGDPRSVQVGMPVEVEWIRYDNEFTLPRFRPAGEA
jgi:uncharacterized protein